MNFWIWLGKTIKDAAKELWNEKPFKLILVGWIITFGYIFLLGFLNGSNIMRSPYFELTWLAFPMLLLSCILPILYYEVYKKIELG